MGLNKGGVTMDLDEKLEIIDEKIYRMSEAADALAEVTDCADIVDILQDRMFSLSAERETLERRIADRDAREREQELRDYYRSVI